MTLPPPNATTDEILDQLLDAEGLLRERLDLALTMLRRALFGEWTICEQNGEWWWFHVHEVPAYDECTECLDRPQMALTPDESRLWEALRKDRSR